MQSKRPRRWWTGLLAVALLAHTGCSGGWQTLQREDLVQPEPASSYLVTTKSGDQLTFISLHLEGSTLLGTRRVTTVEVVGEGETGRQNVTNRYEEVKLPWADVASVEADVGKRADHSMILATGAIAAGVVTFLLLTQDSPEEPSAGGGGKTP